MSEQMPRLGIRHNPDALPRWELYAYDGGNVWTGWVRLPVGDIDLGTLPSPLTRDEERDLVELQPVSGDTKTEWSIVTTTVAGFERRHCVFNEADARQWVEDLKVDPEIKACRVFRRTVTRSEWQEVDDV